MAKFVNSLVVKDDLIVQGDARFTGATISKDGDVEVGNDLEVDGIVKVDSKESLCDKDGNPLVFGGGEVHLYRHDISFLPLGSSTSNKYYFTIYTTISDSFTLTSFVQYVLNNYETSGKVIGLTGGGTISSSYQLEIPLYIYKHSDSYVSYIYIFITRDGQWNTSSDNLASVSSFSDTMSQIF